MHRAAAKFSSAWRELMMLKRFKAVPVLDLRKYKMTTFTGEVVQMSAIHLKEFVLQFSCAQLDILKPKGGCRMQCYQSLSHHFSLSCRKWDSLADQYYIPPVQWINKYTQWITEEQLHLCFIRCRYFVCQWRWTQISTVQPHKLVMTRLQTSVCSRWNAAAAWMPMRQHFKCLSDMNAAAQPGSARCLNPLQQSRGETHDQAGNSFGKAIQKYKLSITEETAHQH